MEKPESLKDWKCLLGAQLAPMSQQTSETLIRLTFAKDDALLEPLVAELLSKSTCFGVLYKRLEAYGYKPLVSTNAIIFLSSLCRNPAMAVMWGYTVGLLLEQNNWQRITLETICMGHFGMGFPQEDEYRRIWDEQKIPTDLRPPMLDNYIDVMPWPKPPTTSA